MTENSYEGAEVDVAGEAARADGMSVIESKLAILHGPHEQQTVLSKSVMACELVDGGIGDGVASFSINDTLELVISGLVSFCEMACDQSGVKLSEGMPSFLESVAATLSNVPYDEEDDKRQEQWHKDSE